MLLASKYLIALFATVSIELIVAFVLGYRNKVSISSVILVNLITNPLANFIVLFNSYIYLLPENVLVVIIEVSVVIAEWGLLVYMLRKEPKKLLLLSIAMNLASYVFGLFLF